MAETTIVKKKILILCDFFLPSVKAGGPLRSITAIIDCLKSTANIIVATRNHELGETTPYPDIVSDQLCVRDGYQVIYFSADCIVKGIRALLQQNHFDVIYANSFFSPKITVRTVWTLHRLKILKSQNTRVMIAPRGEFGSGALSIKKYRKKLFLGLFHRFFRFIEWHATSAQEANEIRSVVGPFAKIILLPNITSHPVSDNPINLKKENHLNIVFLSRICKKKNILYALELLASVKGHVTFDIYGVIQEPHYWVLCLAVIQKLPPNIQVRYQGECDPTAVIDTLKSYDLFLLPTLNENYGHAIVESLAAGCPVLLSNQTPWHDLVDHHAGWEFDLLEPEKFSQKIDALIAMDNASYDHYKISAKNYYHQKIATGDDLGKAYQQAIDLTL